MQQPHYLVRRSRMGRFNFTLLAKNGRITGVVVVPTANLTKDEIEEAAHAKIRALAGELIHTVAGSEAG